MDLYQIISLIISGLSLLSVVFLGVQIAITNKHNNSLYEEQRRIQTINLIDSWCESVNKETRMAEIVVEELSPENCKKLYDYQPFFVSSNTQRNICQMCSLDRNTCGRCSQKDGLFLIEGTPLVELRGLVTNYLNRLEIVAIAWKEEIVDRKTIEIQFRFLCNPGTKTALKDYRSVAGGGNSYPALREFYEAIEKNQQVVPEEKKPIGKKV